MGESRTVAGFASKLKHAAITTEQGSPGVLRAGAAEAKKIFLATAETKGMRPGGKLAGKNWGVRYDLLKAQAALVRFTGPFHLVESDTKAHGIVPKTAQALKIGDGFAESALHPGTHGKGIFAEAKVIAGHEVPKLMATAMHKVWLDAFK